MRFGELKNEGHIEARGIIASLATFIVFNLTIDDPHGLSDTLSISSAGNFSRILGVCEMASTSMQAGIGIAIRV